MSYGMRGYKGDPFLGGLIKGAGKLLGGVAKVAGGILPGPAGTIARTVGGVLAPSARPQILAPATGLRLPSLQGISGAVSIAAPGLGLGAAGAAQFAPASYAPGMAGGCPQGYHLNKSSYYRGGGTTGRPLEYVQAGTTCVRNRYRNVANPRALRRAISRGEGFGRLVQRNRKAIKKAARAVS